METTYLIICYYNLYKEQKLRLVYTKYLRKRKSGINQKKIGKITKRKWHQSGFKEVSSGQRFNFQPELNSSSFVEKLKSSIIQRAMCLKKLSFVVSMEWQRWNSMAWKCTCLKTLSWYDSSYRTIEDCILINIVHKCLLIWVHQKRTRSIWVFDMLWQIL